MGGIGDAFPAFIVTNLVNCPRCDHNHASIGCRRLKRPGATLTHWTMCPIAGEPVLVDAHAISWWVPAPFGEGT